MPAGPDTFQFRDQHLAETLLELERVPEIDPEFLACLLRPDPPAFEADDDASLLVIS